MHDFTYSLVSRCGLAELNISNKKKVPFKFLYINYNNTVNSYSI